MTLDSILLLYLNINLTCIAYLTVAPNVYLKFVHKKMEFNLLVSTHYTPFCRERGIRTPGPVTDNGFQDRRIKPLCHLSV